ASLSSEGNGIAKTKSDFFSDRPPSRASFSPCSDSSTSVQPVNRFSLFQMLSPWRSRTSLYMAVRAFRTQKGRLHLFFCGLLRAAPNRVSPQPPRSEVFPPASVCMSSNASPVESGGPESFPGHPPARRSRELTPERALQISLVLVGAMWILPFLVPVKAPPLDRK